MNLKTVTRGLIKNIDKNLPGILAGLAITEMVVTVWIGSESIPKAKKIKAEMDAKLAEVEDAEERHEIKKEAAVEIGKTVGFTVLMGLATAGTMMSAIGILNSRYISALGLYSLTRDDLLEHKKQAKELFGEKKAAELEDRVAQAKVESHPIKDDSMIICTGEGSTLFFDEASGRYFRHDIEKVRHIFNNFDRRLLHEDWLSLNELYYDLNLPQITLGNDVGWHVEDGLLDLPDTFNATTAPNGEPCLVLVYSMDPKYL